MNRLNQQFIDNDERNYAYNFDWIIRSFLLENWAAEISPESPSLELGAFQGDMTQQIFALCPKLTVVEGASDLVEILQKRFDGQVKVVNSLFEDYSPQEQFSNIFLVHTLEHLEFPSKLLRKIKEEWLAPGGTLFVAVPNANALSRQIAVQMDLVAYNSAVTPGEKEHGHYRTYSLDTLRNELINAGIENARYGGVILKTLSNGQFDTALSTGVISESYVRALDNLAKIHPDLSASIFAVYSKPEQME